MQVHVILVHVCIGEDVSKLWSLCFIQLFIDKKICSSTQIYRKEPITFGRLWIFNGHCQFLKIKKTLDI
jgi:hypothetical protein